MSAFKYEARLDGRIVGTRTSAAQRVYTHAVVCHGHGKSDVVQAWCGRLDLAQGEARKYQRYGYTVDIVPAVRVDRAATAPAASWKVEVQADGTGTWASNGVRYTTKSTAEAAARDLAGRWTSVRAWRVVEAPEPANAS
jgi:hypothetical protein